MTRLLALAMAPLLLGAAPPPDNRATIADFARLFYGERDVRLAFETYVAPGYIQHNPGIADGRDAAIAALTQMVADPAKIFTVKRVLVDGDIAVLHIFVRPTPQSRGAAVFDMYRLEGGRIVEHWDAIQPVPERSANAHPMF
ncbi:MAG: nuclear transport factor 2 family protein [Novosphingobium sp.]